MTDIVESLKKGQNLSFEESKSLFSNLMEGKYEEITIIEILEAFIKKGETIAKLPTDQLLERFLEEVEIEAQKSQES